MALKIKADIRKKTGKIENRKLIKNGFVPANLVIPKKNEAISLAIPVDDHQ
ncbi:MAG: hypothetical protein U5N86_09455 [Planctomycetota bacterium]|nr:hypothetical protein [Planctomycetota bacterium]